jgi:sugar phosphate isomerase/epimerase
MRISCTSFSFDRDIHEGRITLRGFYEFCRDEGIEAVELWDLHLPGQPDQAFVNETRSELESLGLTLSTIAVNNHEFTSMDATERAHDIAKVKRWIDIVDAFDCPILRVLPGDLKVLNTYRSERYPLVLAAFEECVAHAQARGVTLAIENCPREAKHRAVVDLVEDLVTPFLRTCPDIGNLPQAGRYEAWQELLPYAAHVHAKAFDFDDDGEETTIDYSRAMSLLNNSGYQGYVSLEFEGDGDEAQGVHRSLELIRRNMEAQLG